MYRSQTNNIVNNTTQESKLDFSNFEEVDVDDNLEFSGAKLKILTNLQQKDEEHLNNMDNNRSETIDANNSGPFAIGTPSPEPIQQNSNNYNNFPITSSSSAVPPSSAVASIDPTKPYIGSPRHFFCFRSGLFEQAVNDCIAILLKPANDIDLRGSWLLTEISHWDHEKEKIVILTSKSMVVVKYDFIALRVLEHSKTFLNKVDTVVKGRLSYPPKSLAPHIEGLTNGLTAILHGGIFKPQSNLPKTSDETKMDLKNCKSGFKLAEKLNFSNFHSIERNEVGVRVMWNKGQPIPAITSWNPFAKDIPWKTFTNHPLHGYEDQFNTVPSTQDEINKNRLIYSVENFHYALLSIFTEQIIENSHVNRNCNFNEETIMLQNYVGLGAVLHNHNNLGFFKVRGKFSF